MTNVVAQGHQTHEVVNQAPPRVGVNEYTSNILLVEGVRRHDADWAQPHLTDVGELVGSESFIHDAELANTEIPRLQSHDKHGNRIDEVEYHPSYHRIISAAVAHGAHTAPGPTPAPAPTSPAPRRSCCSPRSSPDTPARSR